MAKTTVAHPIADARLRAILDGEPVLKEFTASTSKGAVDEEARTVKFTITTGSVDRDNDTISPAGWDIADYLRNPVVLWAHDYSQLPVARAIDIVQTSSGLESTAQFPPKGVHPFADTVFELIASGFLNACSVGFKPTECKRAEERDGIDFTRQGLLEWSIVPVPANSDALVVARSKGINVEALRVWASGVLKSIGTDPAAAQALVALHARRAAVGKATRAKQVSATAQALLIAVDNAIDAADELMDNVLVQFGIPDVPVNDPANGDMMATAVDGGPPTTGAAVERADGSTTCPACSGTISNGVCEGCGLRTPATNPLDVEYTSPDPVRWNRKLSKAFDVAGEPLEPSRLEYQWVARYTETPIQQLSVESFFIPSARMGSFLASLDECLAAWQVDAVRSMTDSGREVPPEYETLQLNSTTNRAFMVSGIRFMRRASDNAKLVSKLERHWSGLHVVQYIRHEQASVRDVWTQRVHARALELNYLRGEAFTLGGEFLDRGNLDWSSMFLDAAKETTLRRNVDRINEAGEDMESRGLLLMGPPGTGKTLGGRVMMRQADTTFIWISARDFYRSGAFGAFTYAFDLAAECAPTVLFFEDVDNWLGADTIDLLKTEMDGLKRNRGILTVLTTNFPELLPAALIDRPGRFHDLLELGLPTEAVRTRMLAAWLPEAPPESTAAAAKQTEGFSGAHIRHLADFARRLQDEEHSDITAALQTALGKIQEQRALVDALHDGSSDYRPRRHVRALVGSAMGMMAKRGRVLSSVNETRLRTARDGISAAVGHMDDVLNQLQQQPDAPETAALVLRDEDEPTIAITLLAEPEPVIDGDELRAAIRDTIGNTIGVMVREHTQLALARARGRVD